MGLQAIAAAHGIPAKLLVDVKKGSADEVRLLLLYDCKCVAGWEPFVLGATIGDAVMGEGVGVSRRCLCYSAPAPAWALHCALFAEKGGWSVWFHPNLTKEIDGSALCVGRLIPLCTWADDTGNIVPKGAPRLVNSREGAHNG